MRPSSYKTGMRKPELMDEGEIRRVLRVFASAAGLEVMPAPLDPADILVKMLSSDAAFLLIRNDIANTKVDIARSRRVGSSSRVRMTDLETRLRQLNADRQKIVSRTAQGEGFVEARVKEKDAFALRLKEWEETRRVVSRIVTVLDRPRLPAILRPEPATVLAVLQAVESHVEAAPRSGSLILMGHEPRPSGRAFEPISAADLGLNPRVFSGSIRLCASPGSPHGDAAELAGASVARDALVMTLAADRRPVDRSAWDRLDPFLPAATRKSMLPIIPTCLPHSSPYSMLNKLLSTESWRSIRDSANDRSNSTCVVCGQNSAGVVKAEWRFSEPLRAGPSYGIQRLDDVRSYCSQCAGVVFPAPADLVALAPSYAGYERDHEIYVVNPRMRRLSRLNRWEEELSPDPLAEAVGIARHAHQRRSRVRWALDLSILHGTNIVLHPDMVMHRRGWIMRREDLASYDDHRSVHLTRIFNASFATESGQLHFFDLPPVHESPWDTSFDQFGVDDALGGIGDGPALATDPSGGIEPDAAGPENPDEEDVIEEEGPPFSVSI